MSNTTNLGLFKHDNPPTNENQFDVEKSLNENWDKIDEFAGEQKDINSKVTTQGQQIENLNKQYTQLNQGLQTANMKIEILDDLKAGKVETEEQFRKIYTDQERQDKLINGLKDSAINLTTDKQKSLHIEDSSNMPAKINIFGNREQEIRDGKKNKCPTQSEYWEIGEYSNTTGEKVTHNGRVRLKELLSVQDKQLYFDTFTTIHQFIIRTYDENKGFLASLGILDNKKSITLQDNVKYIGVILFNINNAGDGEGQNILNKIANEEIKPFICLNSEENKDFEEYGVSPSPEFPSKIKNVGDNINLINEENLLNYTPYGATVTSTVIQASTTRRGYLFECKPNTAYTIQRGDTTAPSFRGFCFDENPIENPQAKSTNGAYADTLAGPVGKKITFKTTANSKYIYVVTSTNEYTTPSVKAEEGEIATSYSPYNCGNIGISVFNKNWADGNRLAEEMKEHSKTATEEVIDGKNCIVFNNNSFLYSSGFRGLKNNYKENTQYLIRANVRIKDTSVTSAYTLYIQAYDKSGNIIGSKGSEAKGTQWIELSFVTNENASLNCIGFSYGNAKEWVLDKDSIQIYEANMTEECPIYEGQKIVLPLLEGQRLMPEDCFEKETDGWKEVSHWNKVVLNGTETIARVATAGGTYRFAITIADIETISAGETSQVYNNLISTSLTVASNDDTYNKRKDNIMHVRIDGNPQVIIYIEQCNQMTVDEFKAFLKELYDEGKAIEIYYKTAEITKVSCTDEQSEVLEQLQNTKMYKPVTNITTEENMALIEAQYIADTKTYIDNKYNNLAQQIINQITGGN